MDVSTLHGMLPSEARVTTRPGVGFVASVLVPQKASWISARSIPVGSVSTMRVIVISLL